LKVTLLRNATVLVELDGARVLVDPALDPAGARPPVENTTPELCNPLVELPDGWERALHDLHAVLVTHLHRDHFDAAAEEALDRHRPLLCQPPDAERLRELGFRDVRPVESTVELGGLTVRRTGARHSLDERIEPALGPVSGFVLAAGGRSVYLTSDSVWCAEVEEALGRHRPDVVVANGGAARFTSGGPISMTVDDVIATARARPEARLIVVHLEAINHCRTTRAELRAALADAGVEAAIPADGETVDAS
jgi:L-ascorbate metabolism protein UlaG (beta-lactamase superfamily)